MNNIKIAKKKPIEIEVIQITGTTPAVLTPPPTSIGSTTSGLSSMYSSIADATFSPAFTVDIANIIVIIKKLISLFNVFIYGFNIII
jgi:hypothetical protein